MIMIMIIIFIIIIINLCTYHPYNSTFYLQSIWDPVSKNLLHSIWNPNTENIWLVDFGVVLINPSTAAATFVQSTRRQTSLKTV